MQWETQRHPHKLTDDGLILEVQYFIVEEDEEGTPTETLVDSEIATPLVVRNTNENFVYIALGWNWAGGLPNKRQEFLVRKSDGAVFDLAEGAGLQNINGKFEARILGGSHDKIADNNIYFARSPEINTSILKRVDVSNTGSLTVTQVSLSSDCAPSFGSDCFIRAVVGDDDLFVDTDIFVDANGNLIYSRPNSDIASTKLRLLTSDGGLITPESGLAIVPEAFSVSLRHFEPLFVAPDGNIYGREIIPNANVNISRLVVALDGTATTALYGDISSMSFNKNEPIMHLGNRVVAFSGTGVVELFNPTNSPTAFDNVVSTRLSAKTKIETTENFYYIFGPGATSGLGEIYRFDPNNAHTAVSLIDPTVYEVSEITALNGDKISFEALRKSDLAFVSGIIDLAGNITILETIKDNRGIITLERIL